jgi:hypothetical protein
MEGGLAVSFNIIHNTLAFVPVWMGVERSRASTARRFGDHGKVIHNRSVVVISLRNENFHSTPKRDS